MYHLGNEDGMKLVYSGPLVECGFTGPASGAHYVVRPGIAFQADPADGPALLARYPGLLAEVLPAAKKRAAADERTPEEGSAADGTL
jgi:hypothetical protein